MSSIIVSGSTSMLSGEVNIQGSKNAVLPIIIASLLNEGITVIKKCPKISDVDRIIEVLIDLGCLVNWDNTSLIIDSKNITKFRVEKEIASKTRGSVLFLGALLGRFKNAIIAYPGGCSIGTRPINFHIQAIKELGVSVEEANDEVICFTQQIQGAKIQLKFPSVGATENILLASVLAKGTTQILNAALEPEITCLCEYLNHAGAKISGINTTHLVIEGVKALHDSEFTIPPDRIVETIEVVGGKAYLNGVIEHDLSYVIQTLRRMGCDIKIHQNQARVVRKHGLVAPRRIITKPFPGFPTDLQSQFMVLMSQACNDSCIVEDIFDNRFKTVDELNKLGAEIEIHDKEARIRGNRKLIGTAVEAKDLRGGAALVVAGLVATGETTISNIDYIERGYVDIVKDLMQLNANVKYKD